MINRYLLGSIFANSRSNVIELERAHYESILTAVDRLLHCVDVEEKFDVIVENYRDFEAFILERSLGEILTRTFDDLGFQEARSNTSRKISNLLSSIRLYQDSIERHTYAILDRADKTIQLATSREFDNSLSYRIMDGLRNYAQHRALPVDGLTVGSSWTEDRKYADFDFSPRISVAGLEKDSKFRRKTLDEIKGGPNYIQLKPLIRSYVESLSTIHQAFRDLTDAEVQKHLAVLDDARRLMLTTYPNIKTIGLVVYTEARTDEQ